jgi:DNA-binding NarL/FixJ family response regulator
VAGLICNRFSSVRIIILSTYAESHLINQAKQVGVHGYLLKNSSKEELIDTIKQIFTGVRVFPDSISDNTYGVESGDSFQKKFNLTRRELEIVRLLKENNSNKEIAEKLFLSVFTVETHRKNIMKKLNLHKPAALMKFIYENNL